MMGALNLMYEYYGKNIVAQNVKRVGTKTDPYNILIIKMKQKTYKADFHTISST